MIEVSAIWCPMTRCGEQSRRASVKLSDDEMTISSRGKSVPCPFRVLSRPFGISIFSRFANESSTLSIESSFSAHSRAVSLRRRCIFSCVSAIFLYNVSVL